MRSMMQADPGVAGSAYRKSLLPLASVGALIGMGDALWIPFLSLFLITELDATPAALGAFLLVTQVAMLVVGAVIGRLSDTCAVRRTVLVVGGISGAAGYTLFAVVREYWWLLAVSVTFTAIASAQLPQVFAYGRQALEGSAKAPLAMSGLRMLFSLTWIAGPPLAVLLISGPGFTGLFLITAALYALAAAVSFLWLPELRPARTSDVHSESAKPIARKQIVVVTMAFVLFQVATQLGVLTLPLFVTVELGGTIGTAGLILGVCAALELPFMIGLGALAMRVDSGRLIRAGVMVGVVYYGIALLVGDAWQFAAAQLCNAVMISAVGGVGISYFQDLAPDRTGYATTLFTNTAKVSGILSGPLLGVAHLFGYRWSYGICLAASAAGVGLLYAVKRTGTNECPQGRRRAAPGPVRDLHQRPNLQTPALHDPC